MCLFEGDAHHRATSSHRRTTTITTTTTHGLRQEAHQVRDAVASSDHDNNDNNDNNDDDAYCGVGCEYTFMVSSCDLDTLIQSRKLTQK